MESIDDLLSQVKAEYQQKDSGLKPKEKPLFEEEEFKSQSSVTPNHQTQPSPTNYLSANEENLLAEVKAEFAEQEQAEELKRQQQLKEEKIRQEKQLREEQQRKEQRELRKREALTQQAKEWLKNLNPNSEEGLWFEEFAYSYPSKLEAAIDYLQALREARS